MSFKKGRKKRDNIGFWDTSYVQCLKPERISNKCLGGNFKHETYRKISNFIMHKFEYTFKKYILNKVLTEFVSKL